MTNSTLPNGRVNNTRYKGYRKVGIPFVCLVLLLSLTLRVHANPVDAERARMVATTFLNNNGARSTGLTEVSVIAGFSNVYVFTTEHSFVLIAADDCVQPILGYSLTGRFDFENMPDNKRAWIQGYSDEIRYAVENQLRASSEVTQQWQDLAEGNPNVCRATTVVAPLIQTQWGQGSPYNMLCPSSSVTGCVATAMAQVMKYWNYPTHGIGWHSYIHPTYGELSADFQSTIYDWNNMINSYSGSSNYTQKLAVATLMYHCGVSVNMDYSPNSSGAVTAYVANALITYFNYSTDAQFLSRSNYSDATWINMLKSELNQSRPIQYSGRGSGGGHSFVCDGYNNNNYFHFNWGWEGYCDEYYSINNLNPGPGGIGSGSNGIYNDDQGAIFGIHPSECTANAPSNLTYSQSGSNVTLSWSAASGASSYKVYRNNSFIGNASSTSYADTAPHGSSVYYVRSVDSQGRLSLSSNTVTVTVGYQVPVVDDLAATVSGNNVNLTWTAPEWCYPSTPTATMTYGNGNYDGNLGYNGSSIMYWGHRYLTSNLSSYNNMKVYKVSFYANETGSYNVYVYKGTTSSRPQTLLLQQSFSVGSTGWFDIDLSTPIQIDASKDLWVFICDLEYKTYPATYCSYSGSEGNYYSTNPTSWMNTWDNTAFLIRTFVTDGTYTYNVYRNGSSIANNVNNTSYSDNNLATGTYNYYVKTNYYAGESSASNQVSVQIGAGNYYTISASANPTEGGTITGVGSYLQGNTCTLTATANSGYAFVNWTKDGATVSTNSTYSFTVTENASFVANFAANTPPPQEMEVFAEYYPDENDPNSPYVKVYWSEEMTGDNFFIDFEEGLPVGWNVIDANNDGWTWCLTSDIPSTWTYYASLTLDWYYSGSNAICSGSFINGVGALTPDEYLVSPQVDLTNGSQLSFWVAAADASYPADHFGVFVSTSGTNPSDFQIVQEWTLTAKKQGLMGGFASRNGEGLRISTWYNYTVDLSAYAGSNRYIAFRHFDCSDQYIMCLDDITLTTSRSDRSTYCVYRAHCDGSGEELIANNVTGNQYIDNEWSGLASGNYKYGISVVNGRGKASEIHWNDTPATPNHHTLDVSAFVNSITTSNNLSEPLRVNYDNGWLYYDDGSYATNIGTGGSTVYWGIMFPSNLLSSYAGNSLTKVSMYENDYNTNTVTVNIYLGGTTAPQTLVSTMNYDPVGGDAFHEVILTTPVAIEGTQNLWIVFSEYGTYPANACNDTGEPNNRWISLDGSNWMDVAEAGVSGYGWMIRGYVEGSSNTEITWSNCLEKSNNSYSITASANPTEGGTVSGAGTYNHGQNCMLTATPNAAYSFVNWTKDGGIVSTNATYSFIVTESANYVANFTLNQGDVTQTTNFSQGYNWWSTYIEQDGIDGLGMLQDGLGDNGVSIRSQTSGYNDYYEGYGWYGSLSSINNESSYRVITSAPCSVTITGNEAVPARHPITLSQGWTWIGYVPSFAMDVNVAMAGVEASAGDLLKSQQGYSDYYPGYGWFGSLSTIEPGMGLMYYSTNSDVVTFTYPDNDKSGQLQKDVTAMNSHWLPDPYAYPTNMTMLAVIDLNGDEIKSEDYELAAFDPEGNCRGSIRTMYVDITDRYYAFMTISGDVPVEIHFGLYDWVNLEECFEVDETLMFKADTMIGTVFEPMVLHFRGLDKVDEHDGRIEVFPNPVNRGESFSISLIGQTKNPVRVEMINMLGSIIHTEMSTKMPAMLTAPAMGGVYMLRITEEGKETIIHRLVVK